LRTVDDVAVVRVLFVLWLGYSEEKAAMTV